MGNPQPSPTAPLIYLKALWMLFTGQMVVGDSVELLKIWSGPFRNVGDKFTLSILYGKNNRSVGEPAEGSLPLEFAPSGIEPLNLSTFSFPRWARPPVDNQNSL